MTSILSYLSPFHQHYCHLFITVTTAPLIIIRIIIFVFIIVNTYIIIAITLIINIIIVWSTTLLTRFCLSFFSDHSCNFHNASLTLDPASDKGYSFVRTLTKGATACIYVFDCLDEDRANLDVCERLDTNTLEGENVEGKNFKGDWQRLHFERFEVGWGGWGERGWKGRGEGVGRRGGRGREWTEGERSERERLGSGRERGGRRKW